jgi:Fe-S cluster biogenesis protein NfuA
MLRRLPTGSGPCSTPIAASGIPPCLQRIPGGEPASPGLLPYHRGMSAAGPNLHARVAKVINLIRPAVQSDGGDLELVEVTPEGTVRIRLHGACVGCPSSTMTLQVGIERNLKAHIPEVRTVEAVA